MYAKSERFILTLQMNPAFWITTPEGNGFVSVPLCWEVIDRGPEFIPWVGKSANKVIARFALESEASALRAILIS